MKVILYSAISIDGFIAKTDGDSDWVSREDIPFFMEEIKKAGCIVVGSKTYKQFSPDLYPVKDVFNIVLTKAAAQKFAGATTATSPEAAIKLAAEQGFTSMLIAGGGNVNGAFYDAGLVDEIILDIHPLAIGSGIKVFENTSKFSDYEFVASQNLPGGLILARYKKK